MLDKLLERDDYNGGYNAAAGEYQDLVGNGVIYPAQVVRTAPQNVAFVAVLLIATGASVAERPRGRRLLSCQPEPEQTITIGRAPLGGRYSLNSDEEERTICEIVMTACLASADKPASGERSINKSESIISFERRNH